MSDHSNLYYVLGTYTMVGTLMALKENDIETATQAIVLAVKDLTHDQAADLIRAMLMDAS